jgi:hypothetical protein
LNQPRKLVDEALTHLRAIHQADQEKDVNAPYDGSLVGVVYGLIDLITGKGIIPTLSPGVLFSQRPRSVITPGLLSSPQPNIDDLVNVVSEFVRIFEQHESGIQPLIAQRSLPDILSGLGELSFSPKTSGEIQSRFKVQWEHVLKG